MVPRSKAGCTCDQNRGGTDEWASSLTKEGTPLRPGTGISVCCQLPSHPVVRLGLGRCPRGEAVDVAVVHAEGCRDEDRIVDFDVGRTFGTRPRDVVARYLLAALLNFSGDGEKSAQLVGDRRRLMVVADSIDQIIVAVEMMGGGGAVAIAAEVAFIRADTNAAIISRSPLLRLFGPRSRTSASSRMGAAVSGRNAKAPPIPGTPSGNAMCGISPSMSGRAGPPEKRSAPPHVVRRESSALSRASSIP